ncbi:Maf family protein [Candidatus Nitrospira allomarina]|jgi:nucleoside triphosphate pyrophosphatase|uniref:dTTP/UTP pyrophosphatase n=1 Tax=Candidatus Nitrospira allomarina TaxID=3020900 RepID=A0AA96JT12_9BACT|nr:Maf family protein [Candidatus Nitrospira allomarina]WNM58888.1 Maf family protein [Candidatus Nitrospira allomarina]
MPDPHLILASSSPRRKELLTLLGLSFEIISPAINEEVLGQETPVNHVRRLALEKAKSVASHYPDSLVIGSDTVIELDGQILGKPADLEDAHHMLTGLRGRCHLVHTGLALIAKAKELRETYVETVKVWVKNFSNTDMQAYLKTQDSLGKAGAYSIQGEGAHLIEKIEGDYPSVVGLPLSKTAQLLEQAGIDFPMKAEKIYRTKPYANWKDFS